ncbi:uncharacterized protein [Prorops nasuta]|uniref:uncharacterized protein n=1 Tax=Prorops nasuta TaxID=863751 RepID=UPI0034CF242A
MSTNYNEISVINNMTIYINETLFYEIIFAILNLEVVVTNFSQMVFFFKIWSLNRKQKIAIPMEECTDLCTNLIMKASKRLNITSSTLVLEKDGTVIEDVEVLKLCTSEILLLLEENEHWQCAEKQLSHLVHIDSSTSDSSSYTSESECQSITKSQKSWLDFEVPWKVLEPSVLRELDAGHRNKSVISATVNMIVSRMREYDTFIPSKAFRIVAAKVANKYPLIFKDIDENNKCFGEGIHTLFLKLRDRNAYLNRPHMRKSLMRTLNIPVGKQRSILSAKAGCSNWQPEDYPLNESEETIEEKVEFLKNVVKDKISLLNHKQKVLMYMEATYSVQRLYINNITKTPNIEDFKKEWPILLKKEFIFWHYNKLMGHEIKLLAQNWDKKKYKILIFGLKKKYLSSLIVNNTDEFKEIRVILYPCSGAPYAKHPEGTTENIIVNFNAPCIIIIDSTTSKKFYLYIEKTLIE